MAPALRAKLWKRAFRIYLYHLVMLALAFTVVAAFAVHEHASAISNLLSFYLAHPATAIAGSVLLIYCPPLLDILPLYVIFLVLTPPILIFAARKGWNRILLGSGIVWLLAQFGLRTWMHALLVLATGLKIPLLETGAFNLFGMAGNLDFGAVDGSPGGGRQESPEQVAGFRLPGQCGDLPLLPRRAPLLAGRPPFRRRLWNWQSTSGSWGRCAC